jgi:hypothetical protein
MNHTHHSKLSSIACWQAWSRNPSSSRSRTKAKASSRKMQRGVEEGEDLLSAQEVPPWHGEAVLAWPRWHQARGRCRPHVGKAQHTPAPDLAKGKAEQLDKKLEVAMAKSLGTGGDGTEGIRKQSTRSHEQAGAPSRDQSSAPHLDG